MCASIFYVIWVSKFGVNKFKTYSKYLQMTVTFNAGKTKERNPSMLTNSDTAPMDLRMPPIFERKIGKGEKTHR